MAKHRGKRGPDFWFWAVVLVVFALALAVAVVGSRA